MHWNDIFRSNKVTFDIVCIDEEALLIRVINGKGLLRKIYEQTQNGPILSLVFDSIPLVKYMADAYFCPTCEAMIAAGYGLDLHSYPLLQNSSSTFAGPFTNLMDAFEALKPLLGLLTSGYYMIHKKQLIPTNGEGDFFWSITNTPQSRKATCSTIIKNSSYLDGMPLYLLPTQSPTLFHRKWAEQYQDKPHLSGVGYYMGDFYCALLDGHHKACAATLQKRLLETIVIEPHSVIYHPSKVTQSCGGIKFSNRLYTCEEMNITFETLLRTLQETQTPMYTAYNLDQMNTSFDTYQWDQDLLGNAKQYMMIEQFVYTQIAQSYRLDDIQAIIDGGTPKQTEDVIAIAYTLFYNQSELFLPFTFYVCCQYYYRNEWYELYQLLQTIYDPAIFNFFIEYFVYDERQTNGIHTLIYEYFDRYNEKYKKIDINCV